MVSKELTSRINDLSIMTFHRTLAHVSPNMENDVSKLFVIEQILHYFAGRVVSNEWRWIFERSHLNLNQQHPFYKVLYGCLAVRKSGVAISIALEFVIKLVLKVGDRQFIFNVDVSGFLLQV